MAYLKQQYLDDNSGNAPTAVDEWNLLKAAIREASKVIRASSSESEASTTAHRLALTLSFIRSVQAGDYSKARHLQHKYGKLDCILSVSTTSSVKYKNIKDHAVELMHTDIGDRARELKACKENLTEEVYRRKKDGIARRLKRLLPAGTGSEVSILKDEDGHLVTDPEQIAKNLTEHWQQVFNRKTTDPQLREQWMHRMKDRLATDTATLRPTIEDAEKVFKHLHESAAGPDGISSCMYSHLRGVAPAIFYALFMACWMARRSWMLTSIMHFSVVSRNLQRRNSKMASACTQPVAHGRYQL